MNQTKTIKLNTANEIKIKFDFTLNCKTKNIIYLYSCKHCENNQGYYIGQTTSTCRERASGHRNCFKILNDKYKDSALSYHIFDKHEDKFGMKLENYNLGIIKTTRPTSLDRTEDYYISMTRADVLSINRYKVMK